MACRCSLTVPSLTFSFRAMALFERPVETHAAISCWRLVSLKEVGCESIWFMVPSRELRPLSGRYCLCPLVGTGDARVQARRGKRVSSGGKDVSTMFRGQGARRAEGAPQSASCRRD